MKILQIHPTDNVAVALQDMKAQQVVRVGRQDIILAEAIPQKHKFSMHPIAKGEQVLMYGVPVGKAMIDLQAGQLLTTKNIAHDSATFSAKRIPAVMTAPDISAWQDRTFMGYHRQDGRVGTRNYWLVVPLVFCENKNIALLQRLLEEELGYATQRALKYQVAPMIQAFQQGKSAESIEQLQLRASWENQEAKRVFPHLDGIKFLTHEGGCGGTRADSETLCRLLAGYITHPNVAGATVLSLGCQNAQIPLLEEAIKALDPTFSKPLYVLEQQQFGKEEDFVEAALKKTFIGCMQANNIRRAPAPLSALTLGLECGGSDGFSGLSANPALGHATDLLVALGGTALLAEFPELHGVEQALINRCENDALAQRFVELMRTYAQRAEQAGSSFAWNPSPGNIRDGLITDAMKSAGAARKGGNSTIRGVLDYTEQAKTTGLHLLCTPGNDVESTTGLAGSGANLMVFTTGLGTPTGNPVTPVLKLSSNTHLFEQMPELIDLDAGGIIAGRQSIAEVGNCLLELLIETASGYYLAKAERAGQDDFIPWKRGISL